MTEPSEDGAGVEADDLVAYLDHELDPTTGEQLERRLAEDAGLRKELSRLENVWEALDALPRATVNDGFTHKTVEMVAQAAEDDLKQRGPDRPAAKRRAWLWRLGVVLLCVIVGFVVIRVRFPNPNAPLIEALPVVEKLDEYRAAGDVEFLRALDERGVFAAPEETSP